MTSTKTAAAENTVGLAADDESQLPTARINTEAASQAAVNRNSSTSSGPGSSESNQVSTGTAPANSESQEPFVPGSKPEPAAADKAVQPGAATGKAAIDGEALPAGSPKPVAGGIASEATEAGARTGTTAGSQEKPATIAVKGETLIGQNNNDAKLVLSRAADSSDEKPIAANWSDQAMTTKTNRDGSPAKDLATPQTGGTGEKVVQQDGTLAKSMRSYS